MRRLHVCAALVLSAVLVAGAVGCSSKSRSATAGAGICTAPGRFDAARLPSVPSRQWATDGEVDAVLPCRKTVFVGGSFQAIGPYTGSFASVSRSSGAADRRMPALSDDVSALAPDGGGGWLVGTDHTDGFGGCAELLRIRGDGAIGWRTKVCRRFGSAVQGIARRGSTAYIGGLFTRVGGELRSNAAAVDIATGRVLQWNPRVGGTPVYDRDTLVPRLVSSVVVEGSRVYLGGFFDRVGGARLLDLVAVDAVTARPLGSSVRDFGGDPFAEVDAIAVAPGGTVYIGGRFSTVDGSPRESAAALDAGTGRLLGWDPRVRGGSVSSLAATSRGVVVGGRFTSVGGRGRSNIALVSPATGTPFAWAPRVAVSSEGAVEALLDIGSGIVVAGSFRSVNGARRPYAVLVDGHGRIADWAPGPAGTVDALAYDGRRVALGGRFRGVGALLRPNLAALDARTGRVRAWQPSPDGGVGALAADESRLYVGGGFRRVRGSRRTRLAAFELPSLRLSSWRADVVGQSVDALAVGGSTVYLGGDFERVGGESRRALGAVDSTSGRVLPFRAPLAGDPRPFVYDVAVQNGLLYATGLFTTPSSRSDGFAVLDDRTGSLRWTVALKPVGLSPDASIAAFALSGDRLFVLGDFAGVEGRSRAGAAALDGSSGDLLPWRLRLRSKDTMNFSVSAAAAATQDWVIVGGDFMRVNGEPSHGVAAVGTTTPRVAAWDPHRDLGGFEASFTVAGTTLFIDSYNDADLAAFTPAPRR